MRRLALAVLALVLCAAPAAAQQPVVGGGSFNAAPLLEPGDYHDTVLPDEFLYYGVRLQAGQRLHVHAAVGLTIAELLDLGVSSVHLTEEGPDRTPLLGSDGLVGTLDTGGSDAEPIDAVGPPVGTGRGDTDTEGSWTGPGTYFVSFFAEYTGHRDRPPRAEIPLDFSLDVEGAARPQPSATPTPTPGRRKAARGGGGASAGLAAGIGVAGLLAGAGAGVGLGRRRRS